MLAGHGGPIAQIASIAGISALASWIFYKLVSCCQIDVEEGCFIVRGVFVDTVIPFSDIDSVFADDGLFFLLNSGQRVNSSGFSSSALGAMNGYRGHEKAFRDIKREIERWGAGRSSTSPVLRRQVRLDLVVMLVCLGFYVSLFLVLLFSFY